MRRRLAVLALVTLSLTLGGTLVLQRYGVRAVGGDVQAAPRGPSEPREGLVFRLSEGSEERPSAERPSAAAGTPLSDDEASQLLARLPALTHEAGDETDFALRESSLPAPRTGATVATPFPPPGEVAPPDSQAPDSLEVVRKMPVGDVPLAPHLSVTFSQPMVAVTSHADLARQDVPVRLAPQVDGEWRWVGAKTLVFQPEPRFAMATEYAVEIPAGTRSATGGKLAQAVKWTFTTPPPTIESKHPENASTRHQPLLFASFDQRIDPAAALASIKLHARGRVHEIRLARPDEIEADAVVRRLKAAAQEGRWVAFIPVEPLPGDSPVRVVVGPGTPSAEGPRVTTQAQEWSFRTYGPLTVRSHRCGYREGECRPFVPWQIELSNPLAAERFKNEQLQVSPELPDLQANVAGNWLTIRGRSKGRTLYRVTLAADLADEFGQTLGESKTLTFNVGPAEPTLYAPGEDFAVLDPQAPPRFSVFTINQPSVKVKVYAVSPADWPKYREFREAFDRRVAKVVPPGRLVIDQAVAVRGAADELTETTIDLAPALRQRLGHVVLVVEPAVAPREAWRRNQVAVWIEATQIGVDALTDQGQIVVWATSLKDGKPLGGAEVRLAGDATVARTQGDGTIARALPTQTAEYLVARVGDDEALLPQNASRWGRGGWTRQATSDVVSSFVFDDRKMYRPGEEVRVKGWIRTVGMRPEGDVAGLSAPVGAIGYRVLDSRGNEVLKGETAGKPFGGFELAFKLPGTMNLGTARLELRCTANGLAGTHDHTFEVQEFRRPEYEVTAKSSEGPHLIGGHAVATVNAAYYAGGALSNAEVIWRVEARPGFYTPPNRSDFTFGTWVPWWESHGSEGSQNTESLNARTDPAGAHHLRIDFDSVKPARPSAVHAEATVVDVNRQAWTAGVDLVVHPSKLYVGLRSERLFVERGQPLKIEAIVTDIDGAAVAGRKISLRAERLRGSYGPRGWVEEVVDVQEQALDSASEAVRCQFATKEGGVYRVTAVVVDDSERPNESQLRLWVAGERQTPQRNVEREKVTLVPDKKEYKAGETAEVLVIAPFAPAEALVTLARSGILSTERITLKDATHTLRIKIEEAWTPNVWLQVDLVGAAPRADDSGEKSTRLASRPAFASGRIKLDVPPFERKLKLEVAPREKALEPGGETTIDVRVRDAAGQAIRAGEAAVVVVDEAVLALSGYRIPNPLDVFYAQRSPDVYGRSSREHVKLAKPDLAVAEPQLDKAERLAGLGYVGGVVADMARPAPAPMAMTRGRMGFEAKAKMAAEAEPNQPIRMRTDMRALALFAGSVVTDANGRAAVPVKLPDSLTRYRVMVVATDGAKRFGQAETTITARLPLMARPSAPRFLNFGDEVELPVVLQNQTDAPYEVRVAMRAANATLSAARGYRVRVPANDRVEVRFPVRTVRAGKARFQIAAAAGRFADAANFELPVWTPATTEAFATYGQIDKGAVVQPVQAPTGVVRQFGGLEITTSSTALQALTDAVIYLTRYPFECTEQMSSRILGIVALRDVLSAFKAEGLPKPEEMVESVKRDVTLLSQLQNGDGGFSFWRRGDPSWPYVSIHVANALVRAKAKGFEVPQGTLDRSREHLRQIERHIPSWYGIDARRTLIAYALNVRQGMGDRDVARARSLVREAGATELSFEALGFVLPVLSGDAGSVAEVAAIRKHLANRVSETAGAAHFVVSYGDNAYLLLHSDRRADAILLEALIADQPGNDLIPKLVAGLLGQRKAGRWLNTQENAFVLLALDRYFNKYEKVTPDFVARLWLGPRYAGEHAYRGRTTERQHVDIPMAVLAEKSGPQELLISKDGPGRLYYRIGLKYAPESLKLDAMDRGFTVERRYEAVDDKGDVTREADGTWRIKSGARVRVRLTMVAPGRRYHVALVDPLPAGLEAQNPELKTTGTIPQGPDETVGVVGAPGLGGPGRFGAWWFWRRAWWEHQNMRDERVEAFASLLWEGVWSFSYVARATTPGRFVVPPTKAEEMYAPETFGRSATDRVVVTP
jgi:alpha-2-macroglobulin